MREERKMRTCRSLIKTGICLVVLLCTALWLGREVQAAGLNYRETAIIQGNTLKLKSQGNPIVSWVSSDRSIATVNKKGKVKGKGLGTCKIWAYPKSGKRMTCVVTVRRRSRSEFVTNEQAEVWLNMLGAVESGGQIYGNRDYASFAGPATSTPNESSCTGGAYQEYGENLRELLLRIKKEYPKYFKKNDKAKIAADLKRPWYDSTPYRVYPGSAKAASIQRIIASGTQGREIQDLRAIELLDSYLAHIRRLGVTNTRAAMFLAQCEHLGGAGPVERIVRRTKNKNSIKALRKSLYKDQRDLSNQYQIGDSIFQSRHELCYRWIKSNIPKSAVIG